jgi:hypothetical protein
MFAGGTFDIRMCEYKPRKQADEIVELAGADAHGLLSP